jgi:hypothetical protein
MFIQDLSTQEGHALKSTPASLAQNLHGFRVSKNPVCGHFALTELSGSNGSFSARQKSSYYAAAGAVRRASVSPNVQKLNQYGSAPKRGSKLLRDDWVLAEID